MKYEQLAKSIIENVGGKENVVSVVHCITRLRFKLKDESKANDEVLKNMEDVVTVMKSGGQYQVVIGNHVPEVYQAVLKVGGFETQKQSDSETTKNKNILNSFIDIISSIFTPILGALAATGMIKGFNALFTSLGWLDPASGTYEILNIVGDALFYFLPVFLGYTAIKKFGGSPFIGMTIGAALVYPTLSQIMAGEPLYTLFAGTIFESPIYIDFLGIPVILMSYSSSVIPVILASYFAAKIENLFKKIIPDVVKTFLVPFFTLLVSIPLTFLVIGPVATWAANLIGAGTMRVYEISTLGAGALLGAFWQVFVIFGLHWGLVAIAMNNVMTIGSDPILAMIFAASFAQIGAVLGVWIKTKDPKVKSLSAPAFISGIFGVTEPAIYGITLPRKKPFIISCVAAGIGGGIIGAAGTKLHFMGGLGIFGYPSYVHPEEGMNSAFIALVIATILAFILGFVLTYFFGGIGKETAVVEASLTSNDDSNVNTNIKTTKVKSEEIPSPIKGKVINLKDINDSAFSSGALGKGVAIEPSEGKLYAPVSGTVSALFPSNHAIGIKSDNGIELLIHIGLNTVQLDGKYFKAHVKQGSRIEKGQLLIEFDIEAIKNAGFELTTPVVVTNHDKYSISTISETNVTLEETIIKLKSN